MQKNVFILWKICIWVIPRWSLFTNKSLNFVSIFPKKRKMPKEKYLKHDNLLNFDGLDLFLKLNILKEILGLKNDKLINILNYIK